MPRWEFLRFSRSSRQLRRDTISDARSRKVTKLVCCATRPLSAIRPLSFSPFSASYANFIPSSSSLSPFLTVNDNIRLLNWCRLHTSAAIPALIAEDEKRRVEVRLARYMQIFQACTCVVLSDFFFSKTRYPLAERSPDIIAQYLIREILHIIPIRTLKSHAITDVLLFKLFI